MIEPEVTAVQGRRYLALLIDSALVVATGLGAAYLKSVALPIVGRDADTGEPLVDPTEFERFESLLDFELFGQSEILGIPVVRAQEIGDSMRIFGEDSYLWGVTVAAMVAAAAFFLIPALIQRTPGMLPFGLKVVGVDGTRAGVGAHLTRSVVGVVDMIPGVIPGLVGVIAANTSPRHQRLGDRVAGTAVVNAKLAEFRSGGDRVPTIEFDPLDQTSSDETTTADQRATVDAPIDTTPPPPVDEVHPPPEPVPNSEHDAPLPPPPVHRKASADGPRGDLDQPLVDTEADRLDAHSLASLLGSAHVTSDSGHDTFDDDEGGESVSEAWDAPRVEPAPVWQPTPFDPAPAEAPDPDDARSIDDVVLGEPSVGELISAGPVVDAVAEGASSSAQHGRRATDVEGTGAKTPVWSDKWQAWMYFDAGKRCWLRHDTDTNTWVAVD